MAAPGERVLWLSVLRAGLQDTARGKDPGWPWSRDFELICDMAHVSADRVRLTLQRDRERLARERA